MSNGHFCRFARLHHGTYHPTSWRASVRTREASASILVALMEATDTAYISFNIGPELDVADTTDALLLGGIHFSHLKVSGCPLEIRNGFNALVSLITHWRPLFLGLRGRIVKPPSSVGVMSKRG